MPATGILGGTFDPVHNAHLAMARAALRHLALERVTFIPTGKTRYRRPALASPEHRVAMLRLALDGHEKLDIDTRELAPGASGYTVDTLRALHAEGNTELCLLMGADQYEKLASWREPDELRNLARLGVFSRPGVRLNQEVELIPMQAMPISASDVRSRAARGEDLGALVPAAVANYIARHRLYC